MTPFLPLRAGNLPAQFPHLFFGPPHPAARAARGKLRPLVPAGFQGRAGALVASGRRGVFAALALEPAHSPAGTAPDGPLPQARDLAACFPSEAFPDAARQVLLSDFAGEAFSLWDLFEPLWSRMPERAVRGGGAGLQLSRAHAAHAWLASVKSPCAQLLAAARPQGLTPRAYTEWWEGPSPVWDVKWPGMTLAPRTTLRPLLERLLRGLPYAPDPRHADPAWREKRPEILAVTPHWVAVNKPSGLLSVPGTQGFPDAMTLASQETGAALTAVHRLDADTSGIVVYGAGPEGVRSLMESFRERRARKTYLARLEGAVRGEVGEIELPITTNPLDRLRQVTALGGRPARTGWRVLERTETAQGPRTLVEFTPHTGRTHQLRLHAAHPKGLGCPIAGDPFYSAAGLERETPETPLELHARRLAFPDPETGREVVLEAPAPFAPDF